MKALIIIDPQYDFMPGGALAVPEGDSIIAPINKVIQDYDCVVATQDWHPLNHICFAQNQPNKQVFETISIQGHPQVLWPLHCIQGSHGAKLHKDLEQDYIDIIIRKGTHPEIDSYSAFYDNLKKYPTGLTGLLREHGVRQLDFCGLAADICVYFSIKDGLDAGFNCRLLLNAVKALDMKAFEHQKKELLGLGVELVY